VHNANPLLGENKMVTSTATNRTGNGLGGKTTIVTLANLGGTKLTQAQLDGFLAGVTSGASLVTGDTTPDVFTVAGIAEFTADLSTSVLVALQGTGIVSITDGDYFGGMTVALTATFEE
jgi:hypothetical protein